MKIFTIISIFFKKIIETTIQKDDKVVLKGFPDCKAMTVEKISSDEITCLWVEKGYPVKETFQKSSLQIFVKKSFWKNYFLPKGAGEFCIVCIIILYILFIVLYIKFLFYIHNHPSPEDVFYKEIGKAILSFFTPFSVIISLYALIKK